MSIFIPEMHNIFLHPICSDSFTFCWILFLSSFIIQKIKKKSTTKSPQKILSDEITKKISTWMWSNIQVYANVQLHPFSSCPRINCTAEIRHPSCSMQTGAQTGSKLWITIFSSDSFHMTTFLTLPSIFYPVEMWLWQKIPVGMTGISVVNNREWKQETSPFSGSKKFIGFLKIFCICGLSKGYKKWKPWWQF